MKYKIIVIICYFGELPWYFRYFLHSCHFNSTIDFLIITDIPVPFSLPKNVSIVKMSLSEVKALASQTLGFSVRIDTPYKLCDYKPAYGLIFQEFINQYDFWAQSDIDVIFGNLRYFFSHKILSHYDYLNVRHDYTTGCFSLFRNNEMMNNLFKKSKDYRTVFKSAAYRGFDELNFKHCELSDGRKLWEIETEIECFTHVIRRGMEHGVISAFFDFIMIEGIPGKIRFDRGEIVYKNQFRVALYHLHWLKKIFTPKNKDFKINEHYRISASKIF